MAPPPVALFHNGFCVSGVPTEDGPSGTPARAMQSSLGVLDERNMLTREEVVQKLVRHADELRAAGVEALFLFGSVARNEARAESDVDVFFDHRAGLGFEVIGIQERIREILDARADVTTRRSLHPLLRPRIEAEALRVL
jgi:predicted nucleotidyltransferase